MLIKFMRMLIIGCICVSPLTASQVITENYAVNSADSILQTLNDLHKKYAKLQTGKNANYIPELAKVNPNFFAIAVVTVDGKSYTVGDINISFAIESISKPFAYALALQDNDEDTITKKVGLNATGLAFNSIIAIEQQPNHVQNPLVNAGAIQITSFIKGDSPLHKWQRELDFFNQFSDGKAYLGESLYLSETATNARNKAITNLLASYELMQGDALDALDRYTKACSVMVTSQQLATMGATLANGGINPITHKRVTTAHIVRNVLSEMAINGLYQNSGAWLWRVGLPAKSGVGGGILAIAPGKFAIAVFSPPLDEAGNSARAQEVIKDLSVQWHLHMFDVGQRN